MSAPDLHLPTGEVLRKRTVETIDLPPQEKQIALLGRDYLSNH
jgi:hypothetical protein